MKHKGQIAKTYDPSRTGHILTPWLRESKQRFAQLKIDVRAEVVALLTDAMKVNAFNPDQRRDERGRWTAGGDGAIEKAPIGKYDDIEQMRKDATARIKEWRARGQSVDSIVGSVYQWQEWARADRGSWDWAVYEAIQKLAQSHNIPVLRNPEPQALLDNPYVPGDVAVNVDRFSSAIDDAVTAFRNNNDHYAFSRFLKTEAGVAFTKNSLRSLWNKVVTTPTGTEHSKTSNSYKAARGERHDVLEGMGGLRLAKTWQDALDTPVTVYRGETPAYDRETKTPLLSFTTSPMTARLFAEGFMHGYNKPSTGTVTQVTLPFGELKGYLNPDGEFEVLVPVSITSGLKVHARYAFQTSPQRLEMFKGWIDRRMRNGLLDVKDGNPANVYKGQWWAGKYIASAYKKGMTRAIDEMKKAGIPGYNNIAPIDTNAPEHFGTADYEQGLELKRPIKGTPPDGTAAMVAGAFNTPINADRVALLYGRAFEGMKGITDAMGTSLAGILAQAMVDGRNPYEVAKDINKTLDIGEARSKVIARTEIIRAHHVGAINTYKTAGVLGVRTLAELVTVSGDEGNFEEMNVCPKCQELQEQTAQTPMSLDEILPLIPVHPNCLISWQTPVYTSKGWRSIGAVQVGDLVLTHKGRFRKVTKRHVNKAEAPAVSILKAGRFKLSLTSNHPVLVNGKWIEAGAVTAGDSVLVLATPCKHCGKLKPYWHDYCNRTCLSKSITAGQWAKPEHRANIAAKNKTSMLLQYSSGERDRYACTAAANAETRRMAQAGIHPLQWLDQRGDKNPSKRPEVRAKISASKMGYNNAMTRPEVSAKVSVALKKLYKEHPEKHINAKLAQKSRVKNGALTWIEATMRRELVALGLAPVYNHGVDGLWIDFAFPDKKVAVECDGAYWHKDAAKEAKRDVRLQMQGWTVLHFTGSRIKANAAECAAEVYRVLCNHAGRYRFVPVEISAVEMYVSHKRGGYLYNLTVAEDESYVAKGFIVHNCRCVAIPVITDIEG